MDRIAEISDNLIGVESPDDLMLEILEALPEAEGAPEAGNYYTFVYQPKTPGIRYDEFPLVAVTDVFNWGFKGLNFHWGNVSNLRNDWNPNYPKQRLQSLFVEKTRCLWDIFRCLQVPKYTLIINANPK